jgi:hypothetical protein
MRRLRSLLSPSVRSRRALCAASSACLSFPLRFAAAGADHSTTRHRFGDEDEETRSASDQRDKMGTQCGRRYDAETEGKSRLA